MKNMEQKKKLLRLIIFLSILGFIISGYLTSVHNSDQNSFCDINDKFSCSLVSESEHSEIKGIPISLIGLGGYFLLFLFSFFSFSSFFSDNNYCKVSLKFGWLTKFFSTRKLFFLSLSALFFSLYFTFFELFVIKIACLLCLLSQLIILLIVIISYKCYHYEKKTSLNP